MRSFTALAIALTVATATQADDWPQWMGPKRDNIWRETGLLDKFPEGGPKIAWRAPVAGGYAGPAVAEGKVFITDYVTAANVKVSNFDRKEFSGTERVQCLDEASGKVLWKHEYPVKYRISYPSGPRCTPVVEDGKVYTLGAVGNFFCFDVDSGKIVWQKDFQKQYGAKPALWGYAAHPLIDGDKILTLVGGKGSHIVAFDKDSGAEIWKAITAFEQGYSPPTIIKSGGVRQLILLRPKAVTSVNPESGKEYWSVPYDATSGSIIMSPVRYEDYLYVGGYRGKSLLLKLASDKPGAEEVWRDKRGYGISPVNVQPFLQDAVMYGCDESGDFFAVNLPDGKRLWETQEFINGKRAPSGTVFVVKQANRFWLFNDQGELIIAQLSPEGFKEIDRAKILEPTNVAFGRDVVWCMPAFANKRMYVRNDKQLVCVDLSK